MYLVVLRASDVLGRIVFAIVNLFKFPNISSAINTFITIFVPHYLCIFVTNIYIIIENQILSDYYNSLKYYYG